MNTDPLLSIRLSVDYATKPGVLKDVELDVWPGEIVGLAGQSGAGKSSLALAILRLAHLKGGRVYGQLLFRGRDLLQLPEREMRRIRGRDIGLVLQSASSSLNPVLRLETQFREVWRAHSPEPWSRAREAMRALLDLVELPSDNAFLNRLPRQISVGQAQRVLIAMAILHSPSLLIADEPTSALDMITQKSVLDLLARLSRQRSMSILYVSHDLYSVAAFCQRVAILNQGSIVECGTARQIFSSPSHPYTQSLVESIPLLAQAEFSRI